MVSFRKCFDRRANRKDLPINELCLRKTDASMITRCFVPSNWEIEVVFHSDRENLGKQILRGNDKR